MQQILLVEDSMMFGRMVKKRLEKVFAVPVIWAQSMAATEEILKAENGNFSVALLDLNLPDAPHGQVIDKVIDQGISTLVFTTNMSHDVRNMIWEKKVADYIIKEDPNSLDYIVSAIRQMETNQNSLVLIVEKSDSRRSYLSELLYVRKFRVLNASDCVSALAIINQYPDIKLVITDFAMSDVDSFIFCQKVRENRTLEELGLIGFIPNEDRLAGIKYIKSGASDYVIKEPFVIEEFYLKISRTLEMVNLNSRFQKTLA